MEFNCEAQYGGNNGGIMMHNYGLEHGEICGQFLVLKYVFEQNYVNNAIMLVWIPSVELKTKAQLVNV